MKTLAKVTIHSLLAIVLGSSLVGCNEAGINEEENVGTAEEMVTSGPVLLNGGFEDSALAAGGFAYQAASGWWQEPGAGIARQSGLFTSGNLPLPEADHVAFLQGATFMFQNVDGFVPNTKYALEWSHAVRGDNGGANDIKVEILELATNVRTTLYQSSGPLTSTAWQSMSKSFVARSGSYQVFIQTTNPNGGDNTTLVDKVRFVEQSAPGSVAFSSLRTGTWSDSTMWNPSGIPSALESVSIGSAHQVTVNAPAEAKSITLVELSASKLIMNEDVTSSGNVFVGKYCSVDLNDNLLHAATMNLRQGASIQRDPGGRIEVTGLLGTYWSAPLTLQPTDTVGSLHVQRGTGATTATSNVSGSVTLIRDGVNTLLHLGAPLVLTGGISITESTLEDGGNDVTAGSFYLQGAFSRQGTGTLEVAGNMTVTRGALYVARSGDVVHGNLIGTSWSTFSRGDITVNQVAGDKTGLTVDGNISLDATLDKSILTLNFDSASAAGMDWALAWKGNRVAQLSSWYASTGQLVVNFPAGMTFDPAQHIFFDSASGYTYVGYTQVPAGCEQITLSAPGCFWMENTSGNYCWVHPTSFESYTQVECDQAGSGCLQGGACYKWAASAY